MHVNIQCYKDDQSFTKRNKTRKTPQGVCSCAPALCHQLDGPLFLKCTLFQFLHYLKMHVRAAGTGDLCVGT